MNKQALQKKINEKVRVIDQALDQYLPNPQETPQVIHEAMRYSIFAGGKRLRPIMLLAAAESVGGSQEQFLPSACAMEMIHTYSLIHDDLPAMDNDDYRRGKLTSHKVYGEAIAILAGDALLTLAFGLLAENCISGNFSPETAVKIIGEISAAAGTAGMIGGQVVDIQSENRAITGEVLEYIHAHKTGALFKAAVRAGAMLGGADEKQLAELTEYAAHLGMAFQITDDILDVEGDTEVLGKTAGSDQRRHKSTYPSLYGLAESKQLARQSVAGALAALDGFDKRADILRYIAEYLLRRDN